MQGVSLFSWHAGVWRSSAAYCSQKSHSRWWGQTAIFWAQEDQQVNLSLLRHHTSPELVIWVEALGSGLLEKIHTSIQAQLCRSAKRKFRLTRNRMPSAPEFPCWVRLSASPSGKRLCWIGVGTQEIWADAVVLWAWWGLPFHLFKKWLIKKVWRRGGAGRNKPEYHPTTETWKSLERHNVLTG